MKYVSIDLGSLHLASLPTVQRFLHYYGDTESKKKTDDVCCMCTCKEEVTQRNLQWMYS